MLEDGQSLNHPSASEEKNLEELRVRVKGVEAAEALTCNKGGSLSPTDSLTLC